MLVKWTSTQAYHPDLPAVEILSVTVRGSTERVERRGCPINQVRKGGKGNMRSARCDLGLAGDQTKMFSRLQHTPRQGGGCCLSALRKLSTRARGYFVSKCDILSQIQCLS